jgi:hypothetical protein
MKKRPLLSRGLIVFLFLCIRITLFSQSDGLPRGAQLPYTRYEAEDARLTGGASLQQSLQFVQADIASEASNQRYVSLSANGAAIAWKLSAAAQGLDIRFTMPDNVSGTGQTGALGLYVNGVKVRDIDLSSYWAYQYFVTGGSDPYQTPKEKTWMRFDEVHLKLPNGLNTGDSIRIQKDNGDGLTYGVDFIEMESVPTAIALPVNYLSVTSYGAVADDNNDDFAAFNACISAAASQGKNVYIPAGRFLLSDKLTLTVNNIKITGAGVWQTYLYFSTDKQFYGGIYARASNVEISNFSMNTANNDRLKYDEANARVPGDPYKIYKGFMGTYGSNSSIHDIWVEHFECGFWIAGYDPPLPVDITQNLTISNCRIRNNYADGVNFCQGTSNSVVQNCSFRNNGDDAMAVWPNNDAGVNQPCINDVFHNNTVENNWRAGGAAIFGGYGHQVHHCVIKDGVAGSAIRFTNDFSGFTFDNTHTPIRVYENTITSCGTSYDIWNQKRGAVEFYANTGIFNLQFDNNDINNSQRDAVQLFGNNIYNLVFNNTHINGTGLDTVTRNVPQDVYGGFGIYCQANSQTCTFNKLTVTNAESGTFINRNTSFQLVITDVTVPVTGVSISPSGDTTVGIGQTIQLGAVITPTDATNKNVTWTSSNTAAVTVDATGKITAAGIGVANITVTTADGAKTAVKKVTVTPAVNITATDGAAGESGDPGVFVISTAGITQSITVQYRIGGTASPADYTPVLSGSVTLTPSSLSQTVVVSPVDDNVFEGPETLQLTLLSGSGYKLGGDTIATVTIADNDNPPCVSPVIAQVSGTAPVIDQNIETVWGIAPVKNIANTVIGAAPPGYSGSWRALYDNTNLYLLVQVNDATKVNDSGGNWWMDDVVEVFIDGDNSKGAAYDGVNDFQLGFRWNDNTIHVGGNSVTRTTGINYSMYATATGYNLEAVIPWSTIGVTPAIGKPIGLDIQLDNDDNGGDRDAQLASFATNTTAFQNPSVFGTVYLTTCSGSTNHAPVANAGPDLTLNAGATSATLQGSGSDPDGNTITYHWTQVSGPVVSFNNANIAAPAVTGLSNGNTYVFQLSVSDGSLSANDQVQVTVNGSTGPQPGTVLCYQAAGAIAVDGNLNESSWKINQAIGKAVIGSSTNTGSFGVLWDNTNLYIGAKVQDAQLFSGAANAWDNDAVEVFFDANNNKLTTYDGRDNQLIKGYNNSTLFTKVSVTGIQHAWSAIPGGYSVELSIPWSQLGLTPGAGLSIGFDIGYDNADNSSGRNAQYVWFGTINDYQNTSGFGTLTLNTGPAPSAQAPAIANVPALALPDPARGIDLIITPNPVISGQARTLLTGDAASGILQVFDMAGKIILQQQIRSGTTLDLHSLTKGMYLVKFITGNRVLSKKLLIAQ